VGRELQEVASTPTVPALKLSEASSSIWEGTSPSTMSCHLFSRAWQKTWLLGLKLPALRSLWRPHWVSCCLRSSCCFTPKSSILSPNTLTWSLVDVVLVWRKKCTVNHLFDYLSLGLQFHLSNLIYPASDTSCHVLVTNHRVWIGKWIYCTLKQLITTSNCNCFTDQHTLQITALQHT
jgi:hypothetical protein